VTSREEKSPAPERCAGCGLEIDGGSAGCQAIFDEMLARDFGDAAYFGTHRLLVDCYSLQHPERYCASAKSLAAHLCGLAQILEQGASASVGDAALRQWLDGKTPIEKPELPEFRGAITIADLRSAQDAGEHRQAVERWARAVWEAYAGLHAIARRWISQAPGGDARRA
jgi:hypothetical protein